MVQPRKPPVPEQIKAHARELRLVALMLRCAARGLYTLPPEALAGVARHLEACSRNLSRGLQPPAMGNSFLDDPPDKSQSFTV